MKIIFPVTLLLTFFSYGQDKSMTFSFGFGRTCIGGLGHCIERNIASDENPIFEAILQPSNILLLSIPLMRLDVSKQKVVLGKILTQLDSLELLQVYQPVDYIFDAEECSKLKISKTENYAVKAGNYEAYLQNDKLYILLKIKKLEP